MARHRTWLSFLLVFVVLFSMIGPLSISSVSAADPPSTGTDQITLSDESTPEPVVEEPTPTPEPAAEDPTPTSEPVIEEPTPTPEPAVEEPTPTPEPVVEDPTPTPEPVIEEPTPTPEPAVEAPGAFILASDDGTTIRVAYQDADTSALIPGACFQLHFDNGAGETGEYIDAPCDADDGAADGYTHFDHPLLSTGTYHIVQWQAPTNYPKVNWHTFTVTEAGALNTHVVSVHLGGRLRIEFTDGGAPAPGFAASVYAIAGGGYPAGYVSTNQDHSDGLADGFVSLDHLPAGDYLVEGWHFTLYLTPPLTLVTIDPGQEATITIPVQRGGILMFSTTGVDTGDPLLDACYYLRDSEGETVDHLCDAHDGSVDGVTTFYKLQTGLYTWEQTVSPPGYVPNTVGGTVNITVGEEETVPVANSPGGSLAITLHDENEQPLTGGSFTLEIDVEGVRQTVANSCDVCGGDANDGITIFPVLAPGDYVLVQTGTAEGYQTAPEQMVTITAGAATPVTITNGQMPAAAIRVEFRDQATGDLVPGACMELYQDDGDGGMGDYIGNWCDGYDDLDGVTLLSSLSLPFGAGAYVVRVGWSPSMYPRLQTQTVSVTENAQSELVFTVLKGGRVTIQFREGDEPALNFSAAVFTSTGEFIGNASDNEPWEAVDGEVTIDLLPVGDLYIDAAHTGVYLNPLHVPFSIASGEDKTITIQVERGGVLKFETTDSEDNPLLDACYYLRNSEGEGVDHLCDGHDGAVDGVTTFYKLLTGDYTWEQIVSAPNYVPVSGSFPVSITTGEELTIPVTNELGGSVIVTLEDEEQQPLLGGVFRLDREVGGGGREQVVYGCDACADGEPNGITYINGVAPGEYILVQTFAPLGYKAAGEQIVTVVAGQATPVTLTNVVWVPSVDPPVAVADEATTSPGQPVTIPVLENDYDPDTPHEELTLQLDPFSFPSHGHVAISGDDPRAIVYTPNAGFIGTDFFAYIVSDDANSATGYVTVYVRGDLTLEIHNFDQTGAATIGGPAFSIYLIDGETELFVATGWAQWDSPVGLVSFDGLVEGEYRVQNYAAPNGMAFHPDFTVSVGPEPVTTVTIIHELTPESGALAIRVTGPDEVTPLTGACWTYLLDGEESWSATYFCDNYDGLNDGLLRAYWLEPGTYTLTPDSAPAGHAAPAARTFTITAGEFTILDIAYQSGDHLRIATVHEDSSTVVGVCANVVSDAGVTVASSCDSDWSDGAADGVIAFPVLPAGHYAAFIALGGPADSYLPSKIFTFDVLGDGTVVTPGGNPYVVTFLTGGGARFNLVDSLGQPFSGNAGFALYHDAGDGTRGQPVSGLGTFYWPNYEYDDEWNIIASRVAIEGLAPGNYLFGLSWGLGWTVSPDVPITIVAGETTPVEVTVAPQTGDLLMLDGEISSLMHFMPITSAAIGETIRVRFSISNLGLFDVSNVVLSTSHFDDYFVAGTIYGGDTGYGAEFTYTVTEADAARGSLTITATLTATGGGPASKTLTIAITAPPNTPVDPTEPVIAAGGTGATLTFSSVTEAGFTAAIPVAEAPELPAGFKLDSALFFEINTTAVFNGQVLVCIPYDTGALTNPRLLHYSGGEWIDITSEADSSAGLTCGYTDHFSLFALAEPDPPATPVTLIVDNVDRHGLPIRNACVGLFAMIDGAPSYIAAYCDTESTPGRITIEEISPGEYMLRPNSPGGGWIDLPDQLVSVGTDPVTMIELEYDIYPFFAALALLATGPDGTTPLPGACWSLDRDGYSWYLACDHFDGVTDGVTRIPGIEEVGQYTLRQTVTPLGHAKPNDQSITLSAGSYPWLVVPHAAGDYLTIITLHESGSRIVPACVTIRTAAGAQLDVICDGEGNAEDGEIAFPVYPPGDYIATVSGPTSDDFYLPASSRTFSFSVAGDGAVITPDGGNTQVVTYLIAASVSISFVDEGGQTLEGRLCVFLYHDAGDGTRGPKAGLLHDELCPEEDFAGDQWIHPIQVGGLAPGQYLIGLARGIGYAMPADLPVTLVAGETTPAVVTLVEQTGALLTLEGEFQSQSFIRLESVALGQTLVIAFRASNLGVVDLTNVVLSGSHFPDYELAPFFPAGFVGMGTGFYYTVTEADAAAGLLTVTATLTSNEIEPVALTMTIPVTAPPNTPEDPAAPVVAAGGTGATLTFTDVSQAGFSAVIPLAEAPPLPDGFSLDGALFFEISTTAVFDGQVLVCIPYDTGLLTNPRLLHYDGGEWIDITSEADSSEGTVCGHTTHFSPFAVVQPFSSPSDTTPPVVTVPGPIAVEATSQAGAVVTFTAPTAVDDVDGAVPVSCSRNSGQTFPIGTTTVSCSATDTAGNTGTASFTVKVQTTKSPTNANQCKNNGWKNFNNPFFGNQGQCTAYVAVSTIVTVVVIIFGIIISLLLG